ncbi:MAG: hypothetical protein ABJG41_18075 [Cyclobacteriaceae bacterium]
MDLKPHRFSTPKTHIISMKLLPVLLVLLLLLASCGTSRIIATHPDADIYINNIKKGKGEVEIKRMGPPQKSKIYAQHNGSKSNERQIKREFDLGTLVLGLYTYGIGFAVGWRYPKEVFLQSSPNEIRQIDAQDGIANEVSPWLRPPRVWGAQ